MAQYGIRAGAKKTGRKGKSSADLIEKRDDYIPATQNYQVEEVMLDLLHMAALSLKMCVVDEFCNVAWC